MVSINGSSALAELGGKVYDLEVTKGASMNGNTPNWTRRAAIAALTAGVVAAGAFATAANAGGVTPTQLTEAGWTCIQPRLDPTITLCAPPGVGLPPLPGTPGFADRAPSYEFLVFETATGTFIGTQHLLRPDIYELGKPPCPQQALGEYMYNPRNDLWACFRPTR